MMLDFKSKLRQALVSLKGSEASGCGHATISGIATAITRCTDCHDVPVDERYVHEILFHVSNSPASATFLARRVSHRLETTRDHVVALKTLVLLHRLLRGGDRHFELDMHNLRSSGDLRLDLKHWCQRDGYYCSDHYPLSFLRYYAMFLEERIGWGINQSGNLEPITSCSTSQAETTMHMSSRSLVFLDRVLDYHPTNLSPSDRVVQSAMNMILRESFRVYKSFVDGIGILRGSSYTSCLKNPRRILATQILVNAMLQSPKLSEFYSSCKRAVVSSKNLDYPQVRIMTADEILPSVEKEPRRHRESNNDTAPVSLFSNNGLETRISAKWVEFEEDRGT